MNEAFQGVLMTGNIAQKSSDNLVPIHGQLTKTDRKGVTIATKCRLLNNILADCCVKCEISSLGRCLLLG